MLMRLSDTDPPPPRRSSELCTQAAGAYRALFARLEVLEPDVGLGQRYASGMWALEARARADAWDVPAHVATRVDGLTTSALQVSRSELVDWVEKFPDWFFGIVERRSTPSSPGLAGRRHGDRAAIRRVSRRPRCRAIQRGR